MKKRKIITKRVMQGFFEVIVMLICVGIGYLISFVLFDYSPLVAWAITGAIAGGLYFIITKYIFKEENPRRFK